MVKLDTIVCYAMDIAVVTELYSAPNSECFAHIHKVNLTTGSLLDCPTKDCKGGRCIIHGRNVPLWQLEPMPLDDLAYYRKEGMISPLLVKAHVKALARESRRI